MNSDLYTELAWLPVPPADFRQQCRALAHDDEAGSTIARLASHRLSETELHCLAAVIEGFLREGRARALAPLSRFKLGVLGNGTLDLVVPALVASAARHGIALECVKGDFGQILQESIDADSRINRAKPDAVLLALDFRGLPLIRGLHSDPNACLDDALSLINTVRAGIRKYSGATCILQTLAPPPETVFGNLDRLVPTTPRSLIASFNGALVNSLKDTQDVLLDVAAMAETVGLANWYSPTQWNVAKLPFDSRMVPFYADHVGRLLGAMRGMGRRCLVLDLDNTIWGGIIGDDGPEGIVIGQGDATGEAFLDVQRTALRLRERGIVLAVSSKNNDETARMPFASHPEMLLREDHIAVFQANWNDKATNIEAIARNLSLGVDSMVFLDDNPVERGLVRTMLPQVLVPELPDDPALYARTLTASGYFETVAFSDEDRNRAEFYQDNARRVALQGQVGDLESYLESLKMQISFRPFDATGRTRIAQLINKSNQFNLTTRRYTEADVEAFERDPIYFTMQVRLADIFGDNGMISVIICRQQSRDEWDIDTWLMSCRVLGRRVEHMVLREILRNARAAGVRRILGTYLPTDRNSMVADHYRKLGFSLESEKADGSTTWSLDTAAEITEAPMAVDRSGFERELA
jgi:FkbH-like protein